MTVTTVKTCSACLGLDTAFATTGELINRQEVDLGTGMLKVAPRSNLKKKNF